MQIFLKHLAVSLFFLIFVLPTQLGELVPTIPVQGGIGNLKKTVQQAKIGVVLRKRNKSGQEE